MAFEQTYDSVVGSGTLPAFGLHPALADDITQDRYPRVNNRNAPEARRGLGTVVVNPEDFSVHLGLGQQNITVMGTAVLLPPSPLEFRRALVIHNNGADILYIGGANVTTSNGFPLAANEKIAIDIQGNNSVRVYGVSGGSSDVRILELA